MRSASGGISDRTIFDLRGDFDICYVIFDTCYLRQRVIYSPLTKELYFTIFAEVKENPSNQPLSLIKG